jgi:V-type H+-transporting ATPase subunit a
MNILIFIKWNKDFTNIENPPSIITYMINIGIKFGSIDDNPLWGKKLKNGSYQQENFHKFIFIVCLICVFIMFVPKPLILYYSNKKKQLNEEQLNENNNNNNIINNELIIENEPNENIQYSYLHTENTNINYPSMTDLIVNQVIFTIEYVLGCISNTASYLRLWALSLAHSQLSEVFFDKFLLNKFNEGDFKYGFNILSVIINFFIFANITLFVLMFMDMLECFLHTLRLHWVEFQDKFFKADGFLFESFNFKLLFNDIEEEKEIEYRKKMKKFIN